MATTAQQNFLPPQAGGDVATRQRGDAHAHEDGMHTRRRGARTPPLPYGISPPRGEKIGAPPKENESCPPPLAARRVMAIMLADNPEHRRKREVDSMSVNASLRGGGYNRDESR